MKTNPLAVKLAIPFGILVLILLAVGWVGILWMDRIDQEYSATLKDPWLNMQLANQAMAHVHANYQLLTQIVFQNDLPQAAVLRQNIRENSQEISSLLGKIKSLGIRPGREQDLLNAVESARKSYLESRGHALVLLLDEHRAAEARSALVIETLPQLTRYRDAWEAFVKFQANQLDESARKTRQHFLFVRRLFLFVILSSAVLALAIAIPVTLRVAKESARRAVAEREITQLNLALEQRIADRTEELSKANEGLSREIAQRTETEERFREAGQNVRAVLGVNRLGPRCRIVVDFLARTAPDFFISGAEVGNAEGFRICGKEDFVNVFRQFAESFLSFRALSNLSG